MMVFNKIPKWLAILLLFTFVTFCLFFFVEKVAKTYLSSILRAQINENIPEDYDLKFKQLTINLTHKSLALSDFTLIPARGNSQNRTFQFEVPYLNLDIGSFWDPIFQQTLSITKVGIEAAQIKVIDYQSKEAKTLSEESFGVLDTLGYYLHRLRIRDLDIQGAKLTYEDQRLETHKQFHVDAFDLNVLGFSIDSSLEKHGFLNSRQVEARISGEDLSLPDGKHHFSFSSCQLSTRRKMLRFTNVTLQPKDSSDLAGPGANSGYIMAEIPELSFEGLNFKSSYLDTALRMDVLRMQAPKIRYQKKLPTPESVDQENMGQAAIRRSLQKLSPHIKIDKIILEQAEIDLNFSPKKKKEVAFDIDSIVIYQFFVDGQTILFDETQLPFQEIDVSISNIYQNLSPSIGDVRIKHARLNTQTSSIKLENINIGNDSLANRFQQLIPELRLSGVDIFEIILDNRAVVEEVSILNPITFVPENESTKTGTESSKDIFQSVDDFFSSFFINEIKAEKFNIENGAFQLGKSLKIKRYDYQGRQIQLDTNANTWTEIVPRFSLSIEKGAYQISEQASVQVAHFHRDEQKASFRGISYQETKNGSYTKVNIPNGSISQLQVQHLLEGYISADSLILERADIVVEQKKKVAAKKPKLALEINIPYLAVKNAKSKLQLAKGDCIELGEWSIEGSWENQVALYKTNIQGLIWSSPDLPFTVDAAQLDQLPGKNNFSLNDIKLIPIAGQSQQDSSFQIPVLDIYGWNIDHLKNKKGFKANRVNIDQSFGYLLLPEKQEKFTSSQDKQQSFPLIIDTLYWTNAAIEMHRKADNLKSTLPLINLAIFGLNTSSIDSLPNWYELFILNMEKGLHLSNKDFTLDMGPLEIHSAKPKLEIADIYYKNKRSGPLQELRLKSLQIDSSSFFKNLSPKKLDLGLIQIASGSLTLDLNKQVESSKEQKLTFPDFLAKSINIKNLDLEIQARTPIEIQDLTIQAKQVRYDSNLNQNNFNDYIKSLYLASDHIHFDVGKDKAYALDFGFEYTSWENLTQVHHFQMNHNFRTFDYWNLAAQEITIHDWPVQQLLKGPIYIPKIKISGLIAQDFNDESKPYPLEKKPLWSEKIKAIDFPFLIDNIMIDGTLNYQALAKTKQDSTWVYFKDIVTQVSHVTNIPEEFDQHMVMNATAQLYGEAPLEVMVDFDLARQDAYFNLVGRIKDMPLTALLHG